MRRLVGALAVATLSQLAGAKSPGVTTATCGCLVDPKRDTAAKPAAEPKRRQGGPLQGEALRRESSIDSRHAFGEGKYIVDDRVSNFTVEIFKLCFRLTIDRYAKGCDACNLRLS